MSKAILDSIKTALYADATLTSALGSRIYLDSAPHDAFLPLLVYRIAKMDTAPMFGSVTKFTMAIEFQLYYSNAAVATAYTARDRITAILASTTAPTGFDRCTFVRTESGVPSILDDSWTIIDRYTATAFDT